MQFKDIVMSRYATKKFDGKKIPQAKINELLELVRFAPSAMNLQPWKIKVITDQKLKEQLKEASWNQEQITTCSHLLVFCANTDFDGLIGKLEIAMTNAGVPEERKEVSIQIARELAMKMSPGQRVAWAQCMVFLALGNALNGAKEFGFDSCPMGGFDPEAYSRILNLPQHIVPTVLCPVGYAADKPMPKYRFPIGEIIF